MSEKRKVRFKELASRITGFSIPIFGASWTPPEPERNVVRRLVTFLEDRRVLFNPYILEIEDQVVQSVIEIRQELTRTLNELSENSGAVPPVRAMRAACRRYLDEPHPDTPHLFGHRWGHREGADFLIALGELRATFGTHLAFLAVQYGIDMEGDLASVLPIADLDGNLD